MINASPNILLRIWPVQLSKLRSYGSSARHRLRIARSPGSKAHPTTQPYQFTIKSRDGTTQPPCAPSPRPNGHSSALFKAPSLPRQGLPRGAWARFDTVVNLCGLWAACGKATLQCQDPCVTADVALTGSGSTRSVCRYLRLKGHRQRPHMSPRRFL